MKPVPKSEAIEALGVLARFSDRAADAFHDLAAKVRSLGQQIEAESGDPLTEEQVQRVERLCDDWETAVETICASAESEMVPRKQRPN